MAQGRKEVVMMNIKGLIEKLFAVFVSFRRRYIAIKRSKYCKCHKCESYNIIIKEDVFYGIDFMGKKIYEVKYHCHKCGYDYSWII